MAETLGAFLKDQAHRFGDAVALSIKPGFRWQHWLYRTVDEAADQVAAYLQQEYHLEKGERVVIWAPNRPEWVTAFFGCLRVGAVVVPLDVRSTTDYVQRVFNQTQPSLLFASRLTLPEVPVEMPVVFLEDLRLILADRTHSPPKSVAVAPDDLAEVMFTSGTTGDPKGVLLTHRNILSNVEAACAVVPVKPTYRLLSILPLSHMYEQTTGLLSPLFGGARIVYPVSRQPRILAKTMQEAGITTLMVVPQVMQLFLTAIQREADQQGRRALFDTLSRWALRLPMALRRLMFASVHRRFGGRLQFFSSGGAYLDPALAQAWRALGVEVLQGYGATEASPIVTATSFEDNPVGSVGRHYPGWISVSLTMARS
jgi:long-chain acyl-CoA synthetase